MVHGPSGGGKTFVVLDWCLRMAAGLPTWQGCKVRPASVVYLAGEGHHGLRGRIAAWKHHNSVSSLKMWLSRDGCDLNTPAGYLRVLEQVRSLPERPALIVVDTLHRFLLGDENSAQDAKTMFDACAALMSEFRCAVLLVHHTGHQATERPRGSSAIRSNVDFLLGVFRDEKEMLATVTSVKQKDGELMSDCTFSLTVVDLGVDDDGDKITSLVARHLSSAEEVEQAKLAEQAAGRGGRNTALLQLVSNGMDERSLRKAFYELLEGLDAEAKKKAYFRARAAAVDAKQIEVVQGLVIDLRAGA